MTDENGGQPVPKPVDKSDKKVKNVTSGEPQVGDWLKRVYNSVVDEPLPDDLKNLLARLDDTESDNGAK